MVKFCGKCGSKLDEAAGLCPDCDSDKLNKQTKNPESVEKSKPRQNTTPESDKPLSKKEAKKKRKVDKKAEKKANKKEKHAQWSTRKKVCRFILKLILSVLFLTVFAVGVTGILVYFDVINIPFLSDSNQNNLLKSVNKRSITVEEKSIDMTNDTEGTAIIVVKLPDYELLFEEAATAENPDQYLLKALVLKDYETQEFEMSANVTVENGEKIVHSDEVVHQLLEESLINAINALSEVK